MSLNRKANSRNPYQGNYKRVLCVCSAGLLRSPTAAVVLAEKLNYNTRAVGLTKEYALIPIDDVLLAWADEVVCMEPWQAHVLREMTNKPIKCLEIDDNYEYRDARLMELILNQYLSLEQEGKDANHDSREQGVSLADG